MTNLKISDSMDVELGRDIGRTTVDLSKLSVEDHEFLYHYGLTQWTNDGGSNAKLPGADGVRARVARVESGESISAGVSRMRVSPVIKEARLIVDGALVAGGFASNATEAAKLSRADLKAAHKRVSRKPYKTLIDAATATVKSRESVL